MSEKKITKNDYEFTISDVKSVKKTNNLFTNFFDNISNSMLSNDSRRARELDDINNEIDTALNSEYSTMTRFSSGDFTSFVNKLLSETDSRGTSTNLDKVISDDVNSFSAFFNERYKNINNKYEDLRLITEYLFELEAAVTTMRDNIVSSDDISVNISREISFNNISDASKKSGYIEQVKSIETKYNVEHLIRNIIIPNTLTYGNFFAYTIPYSKIFSRFDNNNTNKNRSLKENYLYQIPDNNKNESDNDLTRDINIIKESFISIGESASVSEIKSGLTDLLSNIEVFNDGEQPLLEDVGISSLSDPDLLKQVIDAKRKNSKKKETFDKVPDGTVNMNNDTVIDKEYKDITGVYVKMLSPLRVIPVYILDTCVGYYILYETNGIVRNSISQSTQMNKANIIFNQLQRKEVENSLVDIVANRIVKKIDKKFVQDNTKFRDLIVNALMYDDLYKKDFKVQFVSSEYMTHFKINEDIDDHMGVSMLKKSLFYAKLYLTFLIFKITSVVTKSNDTRVFYIKNSGIDKNMINNVQNAARQYKDNQISFNDMAGVGTMISKAGKSKDMFVGIGTTGEKAIDFDILAGQDIQMNTDFMEFLRKNMINGTDVPSVIMEYLDSADFAKSIVMANNKYMSKILSVQNELGAPTTEFYHKLLKYDADMPESDINAMTYTFNKPKSLNIQNSADIISNAEQNATFIVKTKCGDSDRYTDKEKDALFNEVITEVLLPGLFDWKEIDVMLEKIKSTQIGSDMVDAIVNKDKETT